MKTVVVIGGGIAGLTAAYTLQEKAKEARQHVDYLLIEAENRLGGKILTENIDGFLVEGGPDCFLSEKRSPIELSRQVGIAGQLIGTNDEHKGTYVYSGGRMHQLPEGLMLMVPTKILPFALSSLISWPGKIRMGLDLILPKRKHEADETLASFVVRRLGREALDKIAEPLIGGIHGGDPETMSLKASFPRFLQMEEKYGSLTKAMLAARKRAREAKPKIADNIPNTYFMSFKNGMQQLVDAVTARLDREKLMLGEAVAAVQVDAGREDHIRYLVHLAKGDTLYADAVILATPADVTANLLCKTSKFIAEKLLQIPMASSATMSVAYRRCDLPELDSFGFVIPHVEGRKINAVTYSSIKWDYRSPSDAFVLLRAFVGGAKNQELAFLDDQEMKEIIFHELKEIMGISAKPVLTSIHRWIKARPQYILGHLELVDDVEQSLQEFPGLFLAGASYRGIGVPDCINSGKKAAEDTLTFLDRQEQLTKAVVGC